MLNKSIPKSSKCGILELMAVIVACAILFPMAYSPVARASNENALEHSENYTIVPGVGVGVYKLGMSKDEVMKILGKTEAENSISANGIVLNIADDSVKSIDVLNPDYKFANGLGVGSSEQEFKQAFGLKFKFEEDQGKLYLTYKDEGLQFVIHKKARTVMEISVTQKISGVHSGAYTIVPGVRVGDYKLGMSKGEVSKRLGKAEAGNSIKVEGLILNFVDNTVKSIDVLSPDYKFVSGLGIGNSEQEFKQAFGNDFQLEETEWKDFLIYDNEGLQFEIHKKNRTVTEFSVYQKKGENESSDLPCSSSATTPGKQPQGPITFPKIDRKPKPGKWERGEMKSLPKYNPNSANSFQVDLRSYDLSKLDLRNSLDDLMYATFDDRTVWPAPNQMPSDFVLQKIMEIGKNPGLCVRSLHKNGITGRGVAIAIIDQPLLVDHQEYADRLRLYEEIHIRAGTDPQMHGPAVASIALGKTVGVAPEAELYYIAQFNFDWEKGGTPTLKYLVQGIHRILEINEQLPKDKKIRVISISKGWGPSDKDYEEITKVAQKAKAQGILVVCASVEQVHEGCDFGGLGRAPLADPDAFESYEPGLFLAKNFYAGRFSPADGCFWVPMDSRTTASPGGIDEYVFYRQGGFSWAVPYIAGVYALAVQVEPNITPERFWALAVKTGRIIKLDHKGEKRSFGPILDPVKLITALQK